MNARTRKLLFLSFFKQSKIQILLTGRVVKLYL